MKFACFLRGVNVSGHNIIKMAELRQELSRHGFDHVSSYIQSGNLIFSSTLKDAKKISGQIEHLIDTAFSVKTKAIIFDESTLEEIVHNHPWIQGEFDPKKAYYVLLDQDPDSTIDPFRDWDFDEKVQVGRSCLYLFYPNGYGKSKITLKLLEKKLNAIGTARNFRTLAKMVDLIKG